MDLTDYNHAQLFPVVEKFLFLWEGGGGMEKIEVWYHYSVGFFAQYNNYYTNINSFTNQLTFYLFAEDTFF